MTAVCDGLTTQSSTPNCSQMPEVSTSSSAQPLVSATPRTEIDSMSTTPRQGSPADPNWAATYCIPWNELPSKALGLLKQGKRLPKSVCISLITAAIRKMCNRPLRKELAFWHKKWCWLF